MGFSGTYLYDEQWHDATPDIRPTGGGPWMLLDIHDSDFTIVTYQPAPSGAGVAYLGVTPRTYFEDTAASAPTDVFREAAALAAWWAALHPGAGHDDVLTKQEQLITFLAQDVDPEDDDLDDGDERDVDDLDDAEVFAEIKTARFVAALDLPLPPDLDT
jgi:hypothetical protein